ncbi:MAG: hypothetical protein WD043_07615 [Gemmatimonadales bacterium]
MCVASAQGAHDSAVVVPGDPRLDARRLVPHRATWRVDVHDSTGGTTMQGFWTDTWTRSVESGQPVIVFHQLFVDTTGTILMDNETVYDAATLGGIRATQTAPLMGARATYRYAGDTVSGTLRPSTGTEARSFRVVFREPAWDPQLAVSILFPLERLPEGGGIRYPFWNQGPGGDVAWRHVRVDSTSSAAGARGAALMHVTVTALNVRVRLRQSPTPPYFPWFVIERPGLKREWTLLDWQPFTTSRR